MKKSGFVYIWFDKKRKMYYIGAHWGHEDDGYICSSKRMRDNHYRYRPQDFKRRILERVDKRKDLFWSEACWLWFIEPKELGQKYYNICRNPKQHWSADPDSRLNLKEKMSLIKKEYWNSPQGKIAKEKARETSLANGSCPPSRTGISSWSKGLTKETDERVARLAKILRKPKKAGTGEKRSQYNKEHGIRPPSRKGYKYTEEERKVHSEAMKGINIWMKGRKPTKETNQKRSTTMKAKRKEMSGTWLLKDRNNVYKN